LRNGVVIGGITPVGRIFMASPRYFHLAGYRPAFPAILSTGWGKPNECRRGNPAAGLSRQVCGNARGGPRAGASAIDRPVDRLASRADVYIPDFIIDIFLPCFMCIICIIVIWQPCVPSLAIAEFTIARCWFISHFFGLSGIAPSIVVIFDMSEHISMCAEAGLNARTAATSTSGNATYLIFDSSIGGAAWSAGARQSTPSGSRPGLIWRKPHVDRFIRPPPGLRAGVAGRHPAHLVVDNHATRKDPKVRAWLARYGVTRTK
jgi:hypothetical protein